jgi:hypothetical protein
LIADDVGDTVWRVTSADTQRFLSIFGSNGTKTSLLCSSYEPPRFHEDRWRGVINTSISVFGGGKEPHRAPMVLFQ